MGVSGVSSNQVSHAVTTTVDEVESADTPEALPSTPPKVGDTFGGITRQSASDTKSQQNGFWNSGDKTGNIGIDSVLGSFASANAGNPAALAATEGAAAAIKQDPAKFLNSDGSVNKEALGNLLTAQFAGVSEVTVPSASFNASESANLQGAGMSETAKRQDGTPLTLTSNGITHNNLAGMGDGDVMSLAFIVIMEAAKSAREDLKAIMDGVKAINKEKEGWRTVSETINKIAGGGAGKEENFDMSQACVEGETPVGGLGNASVGAHDFLGPNENLYNSAPGDWRLALNIPNSDGKVIAGGLIIAGTGAGNHFMQKKDIESAKEKIRSKLDSLSEMGETESLRLQMAMDRLSKLMSTVSNLLKKASDTSQSITQNLK